MVYGLHETAAVSFLAQAEPAAGRILFPQPRPEGPPQLQHFCQFLAEREQRPFLDQAALQDWAIGDFRGFWQGFLAWSGLRCSGEAAPACDGDAIETARFFPGLRLNFADNLLSPAFDDASLALVAVQHGGAVQHLTRAELRDRVERVAGGLRRMGIGPGDRLAAVSRNGAEAVIVFLAAAALGASFSTAAPEMGPEAVIDRLSQIAPSLLFANLAPRPFDTGMPVPERIARIAAGLPSLRGIVALDEGATTGFAIPATTLDEMLAGAPLLQADWPQLPFDQPLVIMFTSGTTGRPKCILHGAGGALLEHLKEHRLHADLRPGDRLFFQTSCSWMMWNWQVSAIASGAAILAYDGPVAAPTLWDIVAAEKITVFGTSPPYLRLSATAGLVPAASHALQPLRLVLSTGSILQDDQFAWVWDCVKPVPLHSISGGTDILGCFVLGGPALPVRAGESPCASLAMDVRAQGATPEAPVGELVCATPFPSRPLGFLNDPDGARFHAAYFAQNEGLWTQGDRVAIGPTGGARLHGRSDGVLNIRGIRVGPAEIYRLLAGWPELAGVMAVEQRAPADFADGRLVLLVVLQPGATLTSALTGRIRRVLAREASAAHVPELILPVAALPLTSSGKQSEAAMTDLVNGLAPRNLGALANPECLDALRGHPALLSRVFNDSAPAASDAPEAILTAIWSDLFGMKEVDPEDDFFELGGSSLMAARLFSELQRLTGIDLPATILLRGARFRDLAEALGAPLPEGPRQVVQLQPGEGRPLFMIHSLSGAVLDLAPLQKALSSRRPLYGIQARGLEAGQAPQSCIAAMARDYLALIRAVQPNGPYTLGGHSFGGMVAFEIAQQLLKAGEQVDAVLMIDTLVHARFLPMRQWLRYRAMRPLRHLQGLLRRRPEERLAYLGDKGRVMLDRLRIRLGRAPLRPDLAGAQIGDDHIPPALRAVRGAALTAYTHYKPRAFAGKLVFIRAAEAGEFDPEPVWRRVGRGGLEILEAPGDHLSMITEPHVQALARHFDRCLA
ncbi:acetoacetate--CoA ligase [Roseomonas sp. 18066]|uniref:acetoacetate--CoA ligase n=1 Tax=Roseomonas sp. 18066 TaxID=2681412 RepID=UPI0013580D4C|nr:acetoacetate--CoA ligase [Roseomonas sp. 18066]